MNNLYHIVNSNLKYIIQLNEIIEHEMKFDSTSNLSRCPNKDPLPVVTVGLVGCNNYRSTVVVIRTCMWYSLSTNSAIKRKYTNPYNHKFCSKKV